MSYNAISSADSVPSSSNSMIRTQIEAQVDPHISSSSSRSGTEIDEFLYGKYDIPLPSFQELFGDIVSKKKSKRHRDAEKPTEETTG